MGDMPRLEIASKFVIYEEETLLRLELAKTPASQNITHTHANINRNLHEWVGPKPAFEDTGAPVGVPDPV